MEQKNEERNSNYAWNRKKREKGEENSVTNEEMRKLETAVVKSAPAEGVGVEKLLGKCA